MWQNSPAAQLLGQGLVVAWHCWLRQTDSCSQRPGPPATEESSAQQKSPSSQAPCTPLWQEHPSLVQSCGLQCSWRSHLPGPPATPGLSGQQTSGSSQAFCTPPLQRHPCEVQGCPVGLHPTEEGVQVPGAPGAALASLAQQRRVLSPQGFSVPVVQSHPTPGRSGSVQTSWARGAAMLLRPLASETVV